jgi:putative ABC transport system permease protein
MYEDLKHAWRALRNRPAATLVAVLCMALGVGANATLFGVVDALHYRPPAGVAAPAELLRLTVGDEAMAILGAGRSVTWPAFEEARGRLAEVAEVAAYAPRQLTLGAGEGAAPLAGVIVSSRYFEVLGVRPYAGRFFDAPLHDVPGAEPVAVLSHRTWRGRFGGDPDMIGGRIELNGVPVTVIGVAAPGFDGVDLGEPEAWLPVGVAALDEFGSASQFTERVFWLQMVARRAASATPAAVHHIAAALSHDRYAGPAPPTLHAAPLRPMFFADQLGRNPVPAWAIGITLAVLLLACATVANLLLAQGVAREREVAVRLALGAPRSRVVRQLLMESVIIALAAAAAATLLAAWSSGLLRSLPMPVIPRLVDARVTGFAFVVALLTTLLFGLVPAVRLAGCSLETVLRRGRVWFGSTRLQHALMVTQISVSFVLLVGAGLFAGSLRNARQIDTGFDLQRLLEVSVPHGAAAPAARQELVAQALERLGNVAGVEAVTAGGIVPFGYFSRSTFHIADGRSDDEQPLPVLVNAVGPDYLRTMGLRTVAGRPFSHEDVAGTLPVALVSETLARLHWRDRSPVGTCIRLSRRHGEDCVLIAGVVGDARFSNVRGEPDASALATVLAAVGLYVVAFVVTASRPSAAATSRGPASSAPAGLAARAVVRLVAGQA